MMSKCVAIHINGCLGVIAVEEHTSGRDNPREEPLWPEYSILAGPCLSGMISGPLGIESMHKNHTGRRAIRDCVRPYRHGAPYSMFDSICRSCGG